MSRGHTRLAGAVAAGFALLGACTPGPGGTPPTTTTMPISATPQIVSFTATRTSGTAPLTTALQWSLSGPAGSTLICRIDLQDDGINDITVSPCTNSSIRSTTFATAGTRMTRLRVTDGSTTVTSTLSIAVAAPSADPFGVTIRFSGTPTPSQQAIFTAAANRWSQVIKTGLADIAVTVNAGECTNGAPAFTGTIDDVVIDAIVAPIDGVGAILGQAGPCLIRNEGGLTAYGVMMFDSADVASLESTGQLQAVILHEMGHVLGFGTLWGSLLVGGGTGYPSFVGPVARGAWNAIGGDGNAVPVEGGGGPGTADGHWSEAILGDELMTGYISGAVNPLSAVTIGSLADLGYGVNLGAADLFGVPALNAPAPTTQLRDVVLLPVRSV